MPGRSLPWIAFALACALLPARGLTQAAKRGDRPRSLGSLFAPSAPGAGAEPELAEIAALLRQLDRHAHSGAARSALGHARDALARARAAVAARDRARATRAKQSAWAALGLASRRIALAAAERSRVIAELRARRAEQARADAERQLEQARTSAVGQAGER